MKHAKFFGMLLAVHLVGGCAARFETVREGRVVGGEDLNPDPNPGDQPSQMPVAPQGGIIADIEVVYQGEVVQVVPKGASFEVRPGPQARDSRVEASDDCLYSGISEAWYIFDADNEDFKERAGDSCDPLAVSFSYDQVGSQLIRVTLNAPDGRSGSASLTIAVVESLEDQGDFFQIFADPMLAAIDQKIQFSAICNDDDNAKVLWDFGDGAHSEGLNVERPYLQAGDYLVQGVCILGEGALEIRSTISLVVYDPNTGSGDGTETPPGDGDTDGGDPVPGDSDGGSAVDGGDGDFSPPPADGDGDAGDSDGSGSTSDGDSDGSGDSSADGDGDGNKGLPGDGDGSTWTPGDGDEHQNPSQSNG